METVFKNKFDKNIYNVVLYNIPADKRPKLKDINF